MSKFRIVDREPLTRREVLASAGVAAGALGATALVWPFLGGITFENDRPWLEDVTVDLSAIQPGQSVRVVWRRLPVIVRRRTAAEISDVRAVPLDALLDRRARNPHLPETAPADDRNRVFAGRDEWLVVMGVCSRNCILAHSSSQQGDYGGWYCPCHDGHFDVSGRARKGFIAENLQIPPYQFISDTTIAIRTTAG